MFIHRNQVKDRSGYEQAQQGSHTAEGMDPVNQVRYTYFTNFIARYVSAFPKYVSLNYSPMYRPPNAPCVRSSVPHNYLPADLCPYARAMKPYHLHPRQLGLSLSFQGPTEIFARRQKFFA